MREEQGMNDQLLMRIDNLEHRTDAIQRELVRLRELASPPEPAPAPPRDPGVRAPSASPSAPFGEYRQPPPAYGDAFARRFERLRERGMPDLTNVDLLGPKALAWAGGIVTVLGVVFFFVLAVNRGWIGPGMRVAFGGI